MLPNSLQVCTQAWALDRDLALGLGDEKYLLADFFLMAFLSHLIILNVSLLCLKCIDQTP